MENILDVAEIPQGTRLRCPEDNNSHKVVKVTDDALIVMTDFKRTKVLTVGQSESMDTINEKMIANEVRLLFVIRDKDLVGVITSNDILGKKPLLYVTERGGSRSDIMARDLMTPASSLEAVSFEQVEKSTVSDIVETMKKVNRQHMLVLDYVDEVPVIRGLLSVSQISKQLGVSVRTDGRANTFAELGSMIGCHFG